MSNQSQTAERLTQTTIKVKSDNWTKLRIKALEQKVPVNTLVDRIFEEYVSN